MEAAAVAAVAAERSLPFYCVRALSDGRGSCVPHRLQPSAARRRLFFHNGHPAAGRLEPRAPAAVGAPEARRRAGGSFVGRFSFNLRVCPLTCAYPARRWKPPFTAAPASSPPSGCRFPASAPERSWSGSKAAASAHTDLKKIEYDLLPAPRVYGHETAGVVVAAGKGVRKVAAGDRVCLFHHIPCKRCFYCRHRDYAQCATYKKVGVTAGFEPAGGGFAQYARAMDWIVERGVEKIPDGVGFERATFVEPVNTCLKGLEKCAVGADETVLVMGQGPIGLLFTALLRRQGVENVIATDRLPARLQKSARFGASAALEASADVAHAVKAVTGGRGADAVIVAASAPGIVEQAVGLSRRGGRVMLFAADFGAGAVHAGRQGNLRRRPRRVRLLQRFGRFAGRIGADCLGRNVSRGGVDFSPPDLGRIRKRDGVGAEPAERFAESDRASSGTGKVMKETMPARGALRQRGVAHRAGRGARGRPVGHPRASQGGVDLRHRFEGVPPGPPRQDDYAAGDPRPRVGGGYC